MSRRSRRIDYSILHANGRTVDLVVPEQNEPNVDEPQTMAEGQNEDIVDLTVLCLEVDDVVDENSIFDMSIGELDSTITKLEKLRLSIRTKMARLTTSGEVVNDDLQLSTKTAINSIKDFIKTAKDRRSKNHLQEERQRANEAATKDRTAEFLLTCTKRSIAELTSSLDHSISDAEATDLITWRRNMPSLRTKMDKITDNYKECLQLYKSNSTDELNKIGEQYINADNTIQKFTKDLNYEISKRELDKDREFKKAELNIKIGRFSGYDSATEYYTFRTNFEKMHLSATPKRLLPDLLVNNYLSDPALTLVKGLDTIDEIWARLKEAYGDTKTILSKRLKQITNLEIHRKDPEKMTSSISKLINIMREVTTLAKRHKIEEHLYYGDSLARIYQAIGDNRSTRFLSSICDDELSPKATWEKLLTFLEKERRVCQQKLLLNLNAPAAKKEDPQRNPGNKRHGQSSYLGSSQSPNEAKCSICQATADHVATSGPGGTKLLQYFTCKKFVEMTPHQRLLELKSKGLCQQCLFPGASENTGKHQSGQCQRDFVCKHPSHNSYTTKRHVLVCEDHKNDQHNRDLLEFYKSRCISRQKQLPEFSRNINLTMLPKHEYKSMTHHHSTNKDGGDDAHKAIYMLQTIEIDEKRYTIFFDSGCSDFICKHDAIKSLGRRAFQQYSGQISMGGVGGISTKSSHGIFTVRFPLTNGNDAAMTGVCMEKITSTFPYYPLQGKIERDIHQSYRQHGHDASNLPALPKRVGGDVDFLVGIKYLRYFPEKIFELPSGLTIYKSKFKNADGSEGIIGGPHEVFTKIHSINPSSHLVFNQLKALRQSHNVHTGIKMLGFKENEHQDVLIQKEEADINTHNSSFNQAEHVGSEFNYRCVKCRSCSTCKDHCTEEVISIKEEVEQDLINRLVTVNANKCSTTATLPLLRDPQNALQPNREVALRVYNQQIKRLARNEQDKDDIIASEDKLHKLGYVDYLKNLPAHQQKMLSSSIIKNFIPWRAVWKGSSLSTPCRIVFDASMLTRSGLSLNDILAKGRNNMNKLLEIFLRWRGHKFGFHTDVQKMYNTVRLDPTHWCLQRYLWHETLDPMKPPEEKIIKTLIYGVKSSGNQAERGLRETAKMHQDKYPEVNRVIAEDVYVDDCISGNPTMDAMLHCIGEIEQVLPHGGFTLKGVTISGSNPPPSLTADGQTVSVAGLKWQSKEDVISLDIKPLNFGKKYRGKWVNNINTVPLNLTRRDCVSKVGEIFDISGLITPITATLKLDLHDLVISKLSWDDTIPENLRQLWISNFDMISQLKDFHFRRAIVPDDASSLDVETLDFGDSSQSLACSAIYLRFKRTGGTYSCQLIFSRSRIVSNMSQPRAELFAAVLNAQTGEVVRKAFSRHHQRAYKFTDSQIVLYWICNEERPLNQWVRNRVIEIRRFSSLSAWSYIKSSDMIADLGTRRCYDLDILKPDSPWFKGYEWMTGHHFPSLKPKEIKLNLQERQEVTKEVQQSHEQSAHIVKWETEEITKFYQFSSYLIDPNCHRFSTVCRILALVIKFVANLKSATKNSLVTHVPSKRYRSKKSFIINSNIINEAAVVNENLLNQAKTYFYKKATNEIERFSSPSQYQHISQKKNHILYYTGRILPEDSVTIVGKATKAMLDLTSTTFAVPLLHNNSPITFSIINEVHWHHPSAAHSGIETTHRCLLKQVYIMNSRKLLKSIRTSCERCRYLMKKTIGVKMGPISQHNVMIAPPFYSTQVDLCGPFLAFSLHQKRKTIKIWLLVFCCSTTTTVSIKVMEDYSSTSFIEAFIRLSCEVGYPKTLLTDEGSQLLKGCDVMRLNFQDLRWKLSTNFQVSFESCPVGGHNMHGRVERKIREIRRSLEKTMATHRLSILQWETLASSTSNSINNQPLAIRGIQGDFEMIDLLTPNRLRLGRNNERSPTDMLEVSCSDRILEQNKAIFDAWFEVWLNSHVPQLMFTPKWFKSDVDTKKGDIVLFLKSDSKLSSHYHFGMVESVETSRDGKVRRCQVRYRNANETVDRFTSRAIRSLVVIHHMDEINLMDELHKAGKW